MLRNHHNVRYINTSKLLDWQAQRTSVVDGLPDLAAGRADSMGGTLVSLFHYFPGQEGMAVVVVDDLA